MNGWPLIANDRLRDTVAGQMDGNRLPHALLIEGCSGSGKRTLARFLAQAAVCTAEQKPCGVCPNCHLVTVGTHPDVSWITPQDGKKSITVAQIRTLRREAFVKAHQADCRVFILTPAESMNDQAQNALLKVLEEPPAGVLFLLLTAARTALLPTVLSRCVVLGLHCPTVAEAADYLTNSGIAPAEARQAAERANGSIGGALAELSAKKTDDLQQTAQQILEAVSLGKAYDLLRLTAPFEKNRAAAEELLGVLKTAAAHRIRANGNRPTLARRLVDFYMRLQQAEELLVTNINVALLFCLLASDAEQSYLRT